jgi:hypothetical protein
MASQHRADFLLAVTDEMERQRAEEGWTVEHDDAHTVSDWVAILARYVGRAGDAGEAGDRDLYARRLVQIAAIAASAGESLWRAVAREAAR